MHRLTLTTGFLFLLLASSAEAQTVDFDLPFQSVDGLSVSRVTFDFKIDGVDSSEAYVGSYGPGTLTTVSDPSLTGDSSGILTLTFDLPTPTLEFGVALSTADSLSPGFTVELFDALEGSLMRASIDTTGGEGMLAFSEAWFTYSGTPVSRAVIDFADAPGNFALDNLAFQVPEPGSSMIFGCGVASLLFWSRRPLI